MLARDLPKKWKIAFATFLVVLGIGGVIMKDYLITGWIITSSAATLIHPKQSKTKKAAQIALFGVAVILGCLYFYLRVKSARK